MATINQRLAQLEQNKKKPTVAPLFNDKEFKDAVKFVSAWWDDNKPKDTCSPPPEPPSHWNELQRNVYEAVKKIEQLV